VEINNKWDYNSEPLHECTGHLNGWRFDAFVKRWFKRIRCVRQIKVKNILISFFYANGIVHKEFVPPGQTVNQQFYLKAMKRLRDSVRKKLTEMWSTSPWQCPCPHGLECAAIFGKKKHDSYPSSSPFTRTCVMTFSCSVVQKARWKGNVSLMSVKWKRKHWRSWTTSALNSFRNVFSSGKNAGTSISSAKESTLKETRVVIVKNPINYFKITIPVIFGSPLCAHNSQDFLIWSQSLFFINSITNKTCLSPCHHDLTKPFPRVKLLFHKDRLT